MRDQKPQPPAPPPGAVELTVHAIPAPDGSAVLLIAESGGVKAMVVIPEHIALAVASSIRKAHGDLPRITIPKLEIVPQ